MSELLPCPFCGGEAEVLNDLRKPEFYPFSVHCTECISWSNTYSTEAEAIAAWNSRADYHGYEQAAIESWESIKAWNSRAERTCEIVYKGDLWWKCKSCGEEMRTIKSDPNYCPNCGCKVVR